MDRLLKTTEKKELEEEFSFKKLFMPLTTLKAIHWIAVIGILVYANMLFNGFVWDDKTYIVFNNTIQTFNVFRLIGANAFNIGDQYRPIPALYFSALYNLFNNTSFFYHLIQLVIHIINTSLVFILLKRLFDKRLSLVFSLIFLVHPVQVESVSYIASTGNPLYFLFGMIALLLSLKSNPTLLRLSIIFLFLFLSFLTNETGILFFIVILLFNLLFQRKNFTRHFIPGIVATIFYFLIRLTIGKVYLSSAPYTPIALLPLIERLINIPAIIFYYLKNFFYPASLAIDQQWTVSQVNIHTFYFPVFIDLLFFSVVGLLGVFVYKFNKRRFSSYIFFLLWFIIGLGLHLQIFPLDMTVADRWFYFPIVGLLGIIGVGIQSIKFKYKYLQIIGLGSAILLLVILSVRTIVRNTNWHDAVTLYNHDIKVSDNFDIETNLAAEYGASGQYKEELVHSLKATEYSQNEINFYNIGFSYEMLGKWQLAEKYYLKALHTNDKNYLQNHKHRLQTYVLLSWVSFLHDTPDVSKRYTQKALEYYPDSTNLWAQLALVDYAMDRKDEAISASKKALSLFSSAQTNYLYNQITNKKPVDPYYITGLTQ